MKFTQTNYLGTKQILKFPDHYVAMTVTVSDDGVAPDEDGNKIVPAGTIVGGNGVLLDPSKPVADVNLGIVAASLATSFTAKNSNLLFVAKAEGTVGNAIKVAFVDPAAADQTLSLVVAEKTITLNLATDDAKAITTTANDVIAAILDDAEARKLVDATPAKGNSGAGVVSALAATALTGGTAGAGGKAEGVLMNDTDVTYGSALSAMIIHGYIDVNKMPVPPSDADIAALRQITFLG